MKIISKTLASLLAATSLLSADVPQMVSYQGQLADRDGNPYHGTAEFKFALINGDGTVAFWKNDDRFSTSTDEPVEAVSVDVNQGLYSVLLGNPAAGMARIDPSSVTGADLFLRVWVRDPAGTTTAFAEMAPDMRIVSVPYAFRAETVADGAITGASIANGSITSSKIASGAVTSAALADQVWLGQAGIAGGASTAGLLNLWSDDPDISGPGVTLTGSTGTVTAAGGFTIPDLMSLSHDGNGGSLLIYDEEGVEAAHLAAASPKSGLLELYQHGTIQGNPVSFPGLVAKGSETGGSSGAYIELFEDNGTRRGLILDGQRGDGGGQIKVNQSTDAEDDGTGSEPVRKIGVHLIGDHANGGGYIAVRNAANEPVIKLTGQDSNGFGRITTQVLEITGGADLAERVDVSNDNGSIVPGMVVCFDPASPGRFLVSDSPYDRTVGGIISGAAGINPGMLMGQHGSALDGEHPVAIAGKVYCRVDTDENGPVQVGDLLTTSSIPGHAMRAEAGQHFGCTIGKAMSSLDSGRGLVLVQVTLN